jgi:eukaryotic-like serine/threonine-protein kinase
MHPGEVIGERFEIIRLAGSGGMGEVFQARDRVRGELVAVKVLLDGKAAVDRARFEREGEALSELRHPGIVQYVAHGETPSGEPYLVMEWLEGEDLANHLKRGCLTVEESVVLGLRVAETLGAAHARGIVHRDLKPSNLFLVGGSVNLVKILDFGIAWLADTTHLTQTGMLLGTPGYMAPEQARTGSDIDARADVFSLGCVLFECLTGARAFVGEHVMALLAKILFEDVPRLRELRPDIPLSLDALVGRMLAKDPAQRPRHGLDVVDALAALDAVTESAPSTRPISRGARVPALTDGERRLLSVVLIGREHPIGFGATQTAGKTGISPALLEMRRTAEASGGRLELLVEGSVLVTIAGSGIATDLAARAARCALALRERAEGRPMALSTGRGEVTGKQTLGDAIDRSARRLVRAGLSGADRAEPGPRPIAIDDVTAGLLDGRFEVKDGEHGLELYRELELSKRVRTLLGKPTSCVGRDRELATLRALFNECIEEPVARVALVTAGPGIGKTRLAHELYADLPAPAAGAKVEVWIGRADALRAGSSFSLLGQVLRGAAGIREGEPLVARQEKLRERVARHVPSGEQARVTEFLGELIGTLFPDDESAPLRAARQDAQLMGEQMRRAWEDFLAAECAVHPTLIVLDDLHWGDLPTVRFIGAALGSLKSLPWMVLALARPEVHELFPKLWVERDAQQIRLDQLTRRASERLVRQVLGLSVDPHTVERLVAMADGNAFYLEELIRAVAEGKDTALPETVVAMVEARIEALEAEARRVLRAASVFGEVFWQGGVEALLGGARRGAQADQWISLLVEREVLVNRPESRFPGETEYAFRHALLREGAYAMLTEDDRILGHKLAVAYLEARGESDPMVLAEHCERGKELVRAGSFYLRAAEQAMRGSDTDVAIARAHRGLASGPPEPVRAALLGVLCESYIWRNEVSAGAGYAEEALRISTPGSVPWARAVNAKLSLALNRGAVDEIVQLVETLQGVEPCPDAIHAHVLTLVMGAYFLDTLGQHKVSRIVLQRLHAIVDPLPETDLIARAWLGTLTTFRQACIEEDPEAGLRDAEAVHANFTAANHRRGTLIGLLAIGMLSSILGAFEQAERALRATMVAVDEFGTASSLHRLFLIGVLADRGALDAAQGEAARLIEDGAAIQHPMDEGHGRWALADVLRRKGELSAAEREARAAVELLAVLPRDQVAAMATLAAIQLAAGRVDDALATAEASIARYDAFGVFGFKGAFSRLVHAEALYATGARPRAVRALTDLAARLAAQAERIHDPELRRSFLEDVPENARVFALERAWSAEDGAPS